MNEEVKNEEVENEEVEQEIPVIKYQNSKGEESEISESDLSESETKVLNDLKMVNQKIQEIDEAHVNHITRQSLVLNQTLLTDLLQSQFAQREDPAPKIITKEIN
jgi:hypothetical protein